MTVHITHSIVLVTLFLIVNGVKNEDHLESSKLLTKPSKISELYIGDLLRTNGKKDLDTASTQHYLASSTPKYINAEKLLGGANKPRQSNSHAYTRSEYLPPLAKDYQTDKEVKRSERIPGNMFETFLTKQGGILERNVLASEQNPPPSRRSYSNDYSNNPKPDCDKNPHQASTNERSEYSHSRRRPPQGSLRSEYNPPPSHQTYDDDKGDSGAYYTSHSDSGPAYAKSKSKTVDSDSESKSLSSYSKSTSFSKSDTSTPNRIRQKAIILGPAGQQSYETPYEASKSEEDSSAYSGPAPNSYENDPPSQYEGYRPPTQPDRSYQDYSPPHHTRPAGTKHHSLPKAERAYSPQPAPYSPVAHHSGNQQSYCKGPHCRDSYSPSREPEPEYSRQQPPNRYETPIRSRPHKQSRHRGAPSYESQPQHRLEDGRQSSSYGSYPHERNHGGHSSNNQRNSHGMKHTSERKHKLRNYGSQGSGGSGYPDQSREGSNYEPSYDIKRSSQFSQPLEKYDTQIRPSREIKLQTSPTMYFTESDANKFPLRNHKNKSQRAASLTPDREVPSVEESRLTGLLPVGSSTSKSVSFSESRSFHSDHVDGSQPIHPQNEEVMDQPSREVQSRSPGYPMAYKPYNSEYPASYVNEQRHHPLHNDNNQRHQLSHRSRHSNGRHPEQRASHQARGDGSASHQVKTKSSHEYKSDITGYKDEYAPHEPLNLDEEFFKKYGISKKAKIIVATAKKPNLFEADGSMLKEGESNAPLHPEEPYSPETYDNGPEPHGPEPYQHDSYGHNAETPYGHNPETSYGHNSETPYGHNPEIPYGQNSGPYGDNPEISYGHKPETTFGYNSNEGSESLEEFPRLHHQMEFSPMKIPGSFDSLVDTDPSFLRNVGSFEFSRPAESSEKVLVNTDDKQAKSFAVSKGAGELLQKHGDGVSRIIFNKGSLTDSQSYEESKKVEEIQAQGSQPEGVKTQSDKSKSPEANVKPEKTAT